MDVVDKIGKGADRRRRTGFRTTFRSSASSSRPRASSRDDRLEDRMVILHTNHGDITLELDTENSPATVANFLQYVRDGHYDNTIFHRVIAGFMVQGGGFEPGHEAETDARAGRQRSGQRPQEQALHGGDGAHVGSAFGDRAVFHQRRRQRISSTTRRRAPQGWGYCVFGKVVGGTGRRRQDQGRRDRPQRHAPERADRRRRHRRAPRKSHSRRLSSERGSCSADGRATTAANRVR